MNRWIMRTTTALALVSLTASLAVAGQHKKGASHGVKAAAAICPVCHMKLTATKTKMNTVAVKHGKGVMYCCSGCKMPAAALAGTKATAHKGHKGHMGKM